MCHQTQNLEEMNTFLERYKLLKLLYEEIEDINKPITSKESELVTKILSTKKSPLT